MKHPFLPIILTLTCLPDRRYINAHPSLVGASTRATFRPVLRTLTQEQASLNSQAAANDSQPARPPSYHAPVTKNASLRPGQRDCGLSVSVMHACIHVHLHTFTYKHRHIWGVCFLTLTSIRAHHRQQSSSSPS